MTSIEQAQRLHDALWVVIDYHQKEYPDITYAQTIGLLETIKLDVYNAAKRNQKENEDESDIV